MRGFTTFSESRKPEEVVEHLNEYLHEMTNIIFKWDGTLDKFVGDEIIGLFGVGTSRDVVWEVSTDNATWTTWLRGGDVAGAGMDATYLSRFAAVGDPSAAIDDVAFSLDSLLELGLSEGASGRRPRPGALYTRLLHL